MNSAKRKILILASSYPSSANDSSGIFVRELASRLSREFDITILTPFAKNAKEEEIDGKLSIKRYKYWWGSNLVSDGEIMSNLKANKLLYFQVVPLLLFLLINIIRLVRKQNVEVIHAHWLIPQGLMAVLYKKIFKPKIKIIATAHGTDINGFNGKVGTLLKKNILKNIDVLTVVSNALKEKAVRLGYTHDIFVYPMGVDTEQFSPKKPDNQIKKRYNIEARYMVFVGGLRERKGVRSLIEAMPEILKSHNDTKLLIIGDGVLRAEMEDRIQTLNIDKSVILLGAIPHHALPPYFATADLFILPSHSEGFGLVTVEAMSCGTLALTTDLEVIHDIIEDGKTGFFLTDTTPMAIAQKVNSLLNGIEQMDVIRAAGRKFVVDKFDWRIVAHNYSGVIKDLMQRKK